MEAIERHIEYSDWITLVLIIIALGISVVHYINGARLRQLVNLSLNKFYFSHYNYVSGMLFRPFNLILVFVGSLIIAFVLTIYYQTYVESTPLYSSAVYLKVALTVMAYFIIKYAIEYFIAFSLGITNWYNNFAYVKLSYLMSFNLLIIIVLLPAVYYFRYDVAYQKIVLLLYLILLIFRLVKVVDTFKESIYPYFLYFILYLCTLEILPLILVHKWLIT